MIAARQTLTLISTTAAAAAARRLSILRDHYNFIAPESLTPPNPNPRNPIPNLKPQKPPYRPPSSLDRTNLKPLSSTVPFDFCYSYTETDPSVKPIGLREPKYSPFGPGRIDREWNGVCAPAVNKTVKNIDGEVENVDAEKVKRAREEVLGEPLTDAEKAFLVNQAQKGKTTRQVNLGRDGLTHNMLNDIHNNWKCVEAVRIRCLGVPTVDMENVCTQLEDKTGGLIIHRHGGKIILYRGRHYNPKKRPVIPLMLWRPWDPIYPRLIKTTIEGLSIEETKEMRKKGLSVPALTRLGKNGYYANLVPMARDAFLTDEFVRIDCKGLERSDYRKIGRKLRDLVPCVLVTFAKEQIVVWRGNNYNPSCNDLDDKSYSSILKSDANAEELNHNVNASIHRSDVRSYSPLSESDADSDAEAEILNNASWFSGESSDDETPLRHPI